MARGPKRQPIADQLLTHLPGWLFLVAGVAMVSLTVIMPTRQHLVQLKGQLHQMRTHAKHMGDEESAYQRFHLALRTDDPIVLRRLAYHELHLKPVGSDSMDDPSSSASTVHDLLSQPQPARPDTIALERSPSRLVRLTCGPQRLGLMAVGMMCICAGLLLPIKRP